MPYIRRHVSCRENNGRSIGDDHQRCAGDLSRQYDPAEDTAECVVVGGVVVPYGYECAVAGIGEGVAVEHDERAFFRGRLPHHRAGRVV